MTGIQWLFHALPVFLCLPVLSADAQTENKLPHPKNIIIMIGDGVGYNHMLASNFYLGMTAQSHELFPVKLALAHYPAMVREYDSLNPGLLCIASGYNPALAWSDTAFLKHDCTESAAAATAIATGVKTYNNAVGVSVQHDTLENLVQLAKTLGKATGVVTTVPFCHATPAGFVAHNFSRSNYSQIAAEMLFDSHCDVIMGCGDPMYDNNGMPVKEKWNDAKYVVDSATWADIIAGSSVRTKFSINGKMKSCQDADGDEIADPWTVIRDRKDFRALAYGKTPKRVLGCPMIYETIQQKRSPQNHETNDSPPFTTPLVRLVPSLSEMVAGALNVLDNNPSGFFIMIEGGATDWASHANQKGRMIEEMAGFFEGVTAVVEWVEKNSNWNETLLIVTGDHETGLLWGDRPFLPLTGNGKGNLPGMNFNSYDHSNSLIPFYAKGTGSELYRIFADEYDSVRGPFIQNAEIAQLIRLLWLK